MPAKILLTTINATYFHCAFGLRYLYANLGELQSEAKILEFTADQNPRDVVEAILSQEPAIVGFGVYIWNTRQTHEVVSLLKRVRPELVVVLGGPEVSYETAGQPICEIADVTVQGEGETLFYEICRDFLSDGKIPVKKWVTGALPDVKKIASPYPYYSDADIKHRVIYVEASRGCPYKCEFCLSSLDKSVRGFDLDRFLSDMDELIRRGARQFKFVDRTFNLSAATGIRILSFFLERMQEGLFLHFEMVPDRLPAELREWIKKFPAGSLQFEIGIQTWNPEVAKHVSRRNDYTKVRENFAFLTKETNVHIHADLIVGLPGENLESFARGFDEVATLDAHEIQVGILKRLKGTPIIRHDVPFGMVYGEHPPFQVLQTKSLSFGELQTMSRFAKFWDLYANSGNFKQTMALIKQAAARREPASLFGQFMDFTLILSERHAQRHGIALLSLVESAWIYLTEHAGVSREDARAALLQDYTGTIKRDVPMFLRDESTPARARTLRSPAPATPRRQERHLAEAPR